MKSAIVPIILLVIVAIAGFVMINSQKSKIDALAANSGANQQVADLQNQVKQLKDTLAQLNIAAMQAEIADLKVKLAEASKPTETVIPNELLEKYNSLSKSIAGLMDKFNANELLSNAKLDELQKGFTSQLDGVKNMFGEQLNVMKKNLMDEMTAKVQDLISKALKGDKSSLPALPKP